MSKNQTPKTARIVDRIAAQRAELEAQLQALEVETQEHEAHLEDRLEKAGRARVAFVEDLLDRFEIPQGTPRIDKETGEQKLTKDGEPIFIRNDPDETKRMERLAAVIDDLVLRAEGQESTAPSEDEPQEDGQEQGEEDAEADAADEGIRSYPRPVHDETEGSAPERTFSSMLDRDDVAS